jgi:two-component system cell cycle response regulator
MGDATTESSGVMLVGGLPDTDRPPVEASPRLEGSSPPQRNTPLLPESLPHQANARATLTVLTGLQAGRIIAIDGGHVTIGRALDAELVLDEAGVSRHHARIAHGPGGGFYVEDLGSTNGTFLQGARVGVSLLHQVDVLQLGPNLRVRFAIVDAAEESLSRRLYESSMLDPLTHAFNRRYLADRMLAEVARAQRANGNVAVLMIDVDALKTVNDRFGHLAGDRALCTVAARVRNALRIDDVFARYGGDEFVVLAIGTEHAEAIQLADRVRRAVEQLHMSARGLAVPVTTSIGVASLVELEASDQPVAALLAMADARMYGAKALGGNRVSTDAAPPPKATDSSRQLAGEVGPNTAERGR